MPAPPAGNAFKSGEAVTWAADTASSGDEVTVTMSEQDAITADVRFADEDELYFLCVTPRIQAENLAVRALLQMVPWLFLVLLAFSLLCAFVYSRYITRPVVRLSGIAERMAELDFSWECGGKRKDEIGRLGQSLDRLSGRLSSALKELETANRALQKEVAQERELDRQRMAFFSAASHELKTPPVTILKGQLSGMLEESAYTGTGTNICSAPFRPQGGWKSSYRKCCPSPGWKAARRPSIRNRWICLFYSGSRLSWTGSFQSSAGSG